MPGVSAAIQLMTVTCSKPYFTKYRVMLYGARDVPNTRRSIENTRRARVRFQTYAIHTTVPSEMYSENSTSRHLAF